MGRDNSVAKNSNRRSACYGGAIPPGADTCWIDASAKIGERAEYFGLN
jgi:hypothetical protein